MKNGKVIGLYIATERGEPTFAVDQVHAIPGLGIEGDRFFNYAQKPKGDAKSGREITLIELEAIESLQNENEIDITPDQTRRNVITHGISLNNLIGRTFLVGAIKLRGVRLCEPCQYLANRTDSRILPSMNHKGGLRAEILTEGIIHIGDTITSLD
jgi:MOSC domain-containing protein YiiM